MNRIWIVGSSGRVGEALSKRLNTIENELFCTDVTDVDITDMESVEAYANMYRPNIIINCASISNEFECENNPDEAYKVNTLGARNLAVQAAKTNAKFVQLSTDDVFAGETMGNYNEFDTPCPSSIYGKSKLAGEQLVAQMLVKYFIIRSSWVYGIGSDYVDYVCEKLDKGEKVQSDVNQISVPTAAKEVADIIVELISTQKYGIYHVVASGQCTRYEFAKEIAKLKGYSEDMIEPMEGPVVNTLLDGMMLRINNIQSPGEWRASLKEYIEKTGGRI